VPLDLRGATSALLIKGSNKPVQEKLRREQINIITKRVIFLMTDNLKLLCQCAKSGNNKKFDITCQHLWFCHTESDGIFPLGIFILNHLENQPFQIFEITEQIYCEIFNGTVY
jgi:hypothetical protein